MTSLSPRNHLQLFLNYSWLKLHINLHLLPSGHFLLSLSIFFLHQILLLFHSYLYMEIYEMKNVQSFQNPFQVFLRTQVLNAKFWSIKARRQYSRPEFLTMHWCYGNWYFFFNFSTKLSTSYPIMPYTHDVPINMAFGLYLSYTFL